MMYRDEIAPSYERLRRVRAQLASARTRSPDTALVALQRQRRELARERRKIFRLRHPVLRMLPVTLSELGIIAGYGIVALAMAVLVWLILAAPLLAVTLLREPTPTAPAASAMEEYRIFPLRP